MSSAVAPTRFEVRAGTPSARQPAIDWLRSLALLEVIGFHTRLGRVPVLAGLGLPLLLVITNLFNCPLAERRGMPTLVRDKVRRLLVPWLFWSGVFAVMIGLEALHEHTSVAARFSPKMLLLGTYMHLWFAPFAIFGGFAVGVLQTWTRTWPAFVVTAGGLVLGAALVLVDPIVIRQPWIGPFGLWIFSLPSVLFGLALGRTLLMPDVRRARLTGAGVGCLAAVAWMAGNAFDWSASLQRYSAAVALVGLALSVRVTDRYVAPFLAPLSLGIYFAHPVALRTLMALHVWGKSPVVMGVIGFALTTLLVVAMRKTPLRRFV